MTLKLIPKNPQNIKQFSERCYIEEKFVVEYTKLS